MKVVVDNNVGGETPELQEATKKNPVIATMVKVELIAAEDLPEQFENRDSDRYQLTVTIEGRELKWMPNKTTLKKIIGAYTDESDNWAGKTVALFLVDQAVRGEMKKVVYGDVPAV